MGTALVVSTIYLRHHYVIDILAGLALAVLAYAAAPALDAWWQRQRDRADIRGMRTRAEGRARRLKGQHARTACGSSVTRLTLCSGV